MKRKHSKKEKLRCQMSIKGPVDQPGRSPDSHSGGRGFKFHPVHHFFEEFKSLIVILLFD